MEVLEIPRPVAPESPEGSLITTESINVERPSNWLLDFLRPRPLRFSQPSRAPKPLTVLLRGKLAPAHARSPRPGEVRAPGAVEGLGRPPAVHASGPIRSRSVVHLVIFISVLAFAWLR